MNQGEEERGAGGKLNGNTLSGKHLQKKNEIRGESFLYKYLFNMHRTD